MKKLSKQEKARRLELVLKGYEKGLSLKQIAESANIGYQLLSTTCKENNIKSPRRKIFYTRGEEEVRPFSELLKLNKEYKSLCSLGYGSIVGDGCIHRHTRNYRNKPYLYIGHGPAQKEYLKWKSLLWSKLINVQITPHHNTAPSQNKYGGMWLFRTPSTETLREFREDYAQVKYKKKSALRKKDLREIKVFYRPDEFLNNLDVYKFLFTLFMDDGSTHWQTFPQRCVDILWQKSGRVGKMPSNWRKTKQGKKAISQAKKDESLLSFFYKNGAKLEIRIKQKQMLDSELLRMQRYLISQGIDCGLNREDGSYVSNYKQIKINDKWVVREKRAVSIRFDPVTVHKQLIPEFRKIAEEYDFPKDMLEYKLKNCSLEDCQNVIKWNQLPFSIRCCPKVKNPL
tara:strand:- start:6301 stop:7497 length:1197 start_codon:yes stop_codon:yes gene_type:complete